MSMVWKSMANIRSYIRESRLIYIAGSHDVHVDLISQFGTLKTRTLRGMFVG